MAGSVSSLDAIFNALPDIVFLVNRQGVFLDCNEHPDMLAPRAQVIGRNINDFLGGDLAARCLEAIDQVLISGTSQRFEYSLIVPAGPAHFEARIEHVDADRVLLMIRNISEQVALKHELEQSRRLSDAIARAQACFINEKDRRKAFDGLLTDCLALSGSEYGFIGEVLTTHTGQPYLKTYALTNIAWNAETRAFYDNNAPQGLEFTNLKTLFGAALTTGKVVIANDPASHPARGGLPKGHPALKRFLGIPIFYGDKLVAMLGVANRQTDYDEQLLAFMQPLMVTIGQLVVAAKAERLKDEFVATVSHELRTPLTSIGGSLGLLGAGIMGSLPAEAQRLVQIAYSNCQRLTVLINDLLDMEKIAAGKVSYQSSWQPLAPLVKQAIDGMTSYVTTMPQIVYDETTLNGWEVYTDGQRLMQILANYLSNAAKFSPPDLSISLLVEPADEGVWIGVRDQGPGIPAHFKARLFEKFAQADGSTTRRTGGTGLGLAISRALAEAMGGEVRCDSVEGNGATFWVRQPARPGAGVATARHCLRVLVVEDEPDVAQLLAILLSEAGHKVTVARSGSQGLEQLTKQVYDVVTLDWLLPDISGRDVIRYIRKRLKLMDLPIVVVSARDAKDSDIQQSDWGDVHWLSKPVDGKQLCDLMNSLVGVRQGKTDEQ